MTRQLPQLNPNKDGLKETILLLNQVRRNSPGPGYVLQPSSSFSLLSTGTTLAVDSSNGWITTGAFLVPDVITGAQAVAPVIRIGSNATHDDTVALTNLGVALVVGTVVSLALVAPAVTVTSTVYVEVQTAGTGPTALNATIYLSGFYR